MIGKSPNRTTPELFRPMLTDFIDLGNELVLLADNIDYFILMNIIVHQ